MISIKYKCTPHVEFLKCDKCENGNINTTNETTGNYEVCKAIYIHKCTHCEQKKVINEQFPRIGHTFTDAVGKPAEFTDKEVIIKTFKEEK